MKDIAVLKVSASGQLRLHDLVCLLQQDRDKPERDTHHHRDLVHGNMNLLERSKQCLDPVRQRGRRGRQRHQRRTDNQIDQTDRQINCRRQACLGDRQFADAHDDIAALEHKEIEQRSHQQQNHNRFKAPDHEAERHLGRLDDENQPERGQQIGHDASGQKERYQKQQRADQLKPRVQLVDHALRFIVLSDRYISNHK